MNKITINEKPAGFLFGYTSYKRFMTAIQLNKSLFISEDGNLTDEAYVEILFCAYGSWCLESRLSAELTREDIARWMDKQYSTTEGSKIVNDLFTEWGESTDVKALIETGEKKNQDLSVQTSTTLSEASLEKSDTDPGNSIGLPGEKQLQLSTD